jgi:exonuclease VII small subunit
MKKGGKLNVAIVGGGPGCKAIMDMIFAKKLSQLRMKLIGVACTNPAAEGYRYAREKGIYTTRDYTDLYKFRDLNMIIELTGREEIANGICQTKPDHVRLMDNVAARLFWDVFKIQEEGIAQRKQAEEELKKYRDHLEELVKERTSEVQGALSKVRALSGLLPICASCKNIRDDNGYWNQIEEYIRDNSEAQFSHSICPQCTKKLYPKLHKTSRSKIDRTQYAFCKQISGTAVIRNRRSGLDRRSGSYRRSGTERRTAAA